MAGFWWDERTGLAGSRLWFSNPCRYQLQDPQEMRDMTRIPLRDEPSQIFEIQTVLWSVYADRAKQQFLQRRLKEGAAQWVTNH